MKSEIINLTQFLIIYIDFTYTITLNAHFKSSQKTLLDTQRRFTPISAISANHRLILFPYMELNPPRFVASSNEKAARTWLAVVYGDTITVSKNARVSDHLLRPSVKAVTRLHRKTNHSSILYSQLLNYSTVDYQPVIPPQESITSSVFLSERMK